MVLPKVFLLLNEENEEIWYRYWLCCLQLPQAYWRLAAGSSVVPQETHSRRFGRVTSTNDSERLGLSSKHVFQTRRIACWESYHWSTVGLQNLSDVSLLQDFSEQAILELWLREFAFEDSFFELFLLGENMVSGDKTWPVIIFEAITVSSMANGKCQF